MPQGQKIYFASDFHLGIPDYTTSRKRENCIVRWLNQIKLDVAELFLMGDVFDFWFEYPTTIPKGYIRFLGKLAELADAGVKIYFIKGNHDMWLFDYFEQELGATIITNALQMERNGKKFYLHHGDGLLVADRLYKILKKIFRSKLCQFLFAHLHPNLGMRIAKHWSKQSRLVHQANVVQPYQQEQIISYCHKLSQSSFYDYVLLGHWHCPVDLILHKNSRYINLGEWVNFNSYAVFDGEQLCLKYFKE